MRRKVNLLAALGFLFTAVMVCQAGDDTAAIIDKAIKAHGMKDKEANWAYRGKNKGTLHVSGLDLEFTQEITLQLPNKFKEVMELTVMGKTVKINTVFNGKEGWLRVDDKDVDVKKEILDEFKEAAYSMRLSQALFQKEKGLKISLIGEVKINDKPAVGIKVTKEGHKDIDFYFDKATGLMAKVERRVKDFQSGQEMTEERIILEYQETQGRKIAKKVQVKRDGKDFLEADVVEAKILDKVDNSEFAKPQ